MPCRLPYPFLLNNDLCSDSVVTVLPSSRVLILEAPTPNLEATMLRRRPSNR